jgi:DNA-binding response OmpR family regulator
VIQVTGSRRPDRTGVGPVHRPGRSGAARNHLEVFNLYEQDRLVDCVTAHAAGADAYLAEPYSPLALLDVVQRLSRG